jgi:nicotinate phosphoribosyltransferase
MSIIKSLLDTDLYKLTMMQCVWHQFKNASAQYKLFRRTDVDLSPYTNEITKEIAHLCTLRFTSEEIDYLASLKFFAADFLDYLADFQFNKDYIEFNNSDLIITGPWVETILFEVPLLAIISEVYYTHNKPAGGLDLGRKLLHDKINFLQQQKDLADFRFSDFGTRRRLSRDWHDEVVATLQQEALPYFAGTSNVLLAKKYNLPAYGTMAHEFLQAAQVLAPDVLHSQRFALDSWVREYHGQLGIALTDVINMEAFLRDFNRHLAIIYTGLRQDSGDPIVWGNKALRHYKDLQIDPLKKTLVFSDNLNIPKAIEIYKYFLNKINTFYGIGTNLTNDFDQAAINTVIKMVACNGKSVAKISDEPAKSMIHDPNYLDYLKKIFMLP